MSLPLKVVKIMHFQMILMATLCKSGTLKLSLTSPQGPFTSTLLTMYLVLNLGGKLSDMAYIDMNRVGSPTEGFAPCSARWRSCRSR